MNRFGMRPEMLVQWARGGIAVLLVALMAAAGSGMLGAPVWANVMRPYLPIQQADNADNSGGPTITLNVNSTLDEVDANPGDGVCASTANRCTLRAAVMEANLRGGLHTINVPDGTYVLTIPAVDGDNAIGDNGGGDDADNGSSNDSDAAGGDLNVQTDIRILGSGATTTIIDGNASTRLFDINSGRSAIIRDVTIRNGYSTGPGGGIHSVGDLELKSSRVTGNSSFNNTDGGIYAIRLSIEDTVVANNSSMNGGGIFADSINMNSSIVMDNSAILRGGGLDVYSGSIDDSTISSNSVSAGTGSGGGIRSQGSFTVLGSTISGNSAALGAGVYAMSNPNYTNTTISGNVATGNGSSTGLGGGLFFDGTPDGGNLSNVTVANNAAPRGSGIYKAAGDLDIRNTIVATNTGSADCFRSGPIISLGNNIDGGAGCGFIATGDRQNTNPNIAALADNGGPTKTHALQTGSPAIDGGTNAGCPSVDQRDVQRPRDGDGDGTFLCDIGAFEASGVLAPAPPDNDDDDNSGVPPPNPDNGEDADNIGPPGTPGQTTVQYQACPGTTYVPVQALTGFSIGDTVRINPGGATQEDARVVDIGCNGRNLHLAGPLQFRHQAGETVVIAGQPAVSSVTQSGDDSRREQAQRRTEEQRQQDQQTNQLGRDDIHTEGDVASVDFSKQPPEIVILTRDGPQTVQLLCGDQCPTIREGDYVEVDGVKENEGLFYAETVTVTSR